MLKLAFKPCIKNACIFARVITITKPAIMTAQRFFLGIGIFILLVLAFSGAHAQEKQPSVLKLSGSYYFPETKVQPVCDYLSEKLDIPVQAEGFASTKQLNNQLKNKTVHLAFLNPYSYVLAKELVKHIEPMVVLGNDAGPYTYHSCIIANPHARVHSMKALKQKAGMIDFSFVHATSTSGHIVPRFQLKQIGLPQAEGRFNNVEFAGSHAKNIKMVKNGVVHAGACGKPDLQYAKEAGWLKPGDVEVLWTSHEITGSPLVVQQNLPEDLKNRIERIFLDMHHDNPKLWKFIQNNWQAINPERFIEARDSDWDKLRSVADSMDDLVMFLSFYLS